MASDRRTILQTIAAIAAARTIPGNSRSATTRDDAAYGSTYGAAYGDAE